MRLSKSSFIWLAIVMCIPAAFQARPFAAQSAASGTIEGTVTDATGAVVSGATVEIKNVLTNYDKTTTTDSSGVFQFSNLPFNNYYLRSPSRGFDVATDLNIRSTVPVSIVVALAVGVGSARQSRSKHRGPTCWKRFPMRIAT